MNRNKTNRSFDYPAMGRCLETEHSSWAFGVNPRQGVRLVIK